MQLDAHLGSPSQNGGEKDFVDKRGRVPVAREEGDIGVSRWTKLADVALVQAVIAHAVRLVTQSDTVQHCLPFVKCTSELQTRRTKFVELPECECACLARRKVLREIGPAAASWGEELRKGIVSCELVIGAASRGQCKVTTSSLLATVKKCGVS